MGEGRGVWGRAATSLLSLTALKGIAAGSSLSAPLHHEVMLCPVTRSGQLLLGWFAEVCITSPLSPAPRCFD